MIFTVETKVNLEFLEKLKRNLERLDGEHKLPLNEILNEDFLCEHTTFKDFDDIFESSGIKITTERTLEELCLNDELNEFIKAETKFEDFRDMFKSALNEYLSKILLDFSD